MFKPRFGGINFSLNICRAVVVGPLTFILWLWWALTRRSYNYLKSFSPATQNSTYKRLIKSKCNLTEGVRSLDDQSVLPAADSGVNESLVRSSQETNVPYPQQQEEMNVLASSSSASKQATARTHFHSQSSGRDGRSLVAGEAAAAAAAADENETTAARGSFSCHATTHTSTNASATVTDKWCPGRCEEHNISSSARTDAKQSHNNQSVTSESSKSGIKKTKSHESNVTKHESAVTESTSEPLLTCADKSSLKDSFDPLKSLYWTSVELPKIYRIKQITRSCLNDVILAGISGERNTSPVILHLSLLPFVCCI